MKLSKAQHAHRADILMRSICDEVESHLKNEDTQKQKLANFIGITPSNLSKKLERASFSIYEVLLIAEFFKMDIYEFLVGAKRNDVNFHNETQMSSYSIHYLKTSRTSNPHLMDMVDLVFENENIANSLFSLLYWYASSDVSYVTFPVKGKPEEKIARKISDGSLYLKYLLEKSFIDLCKIVKEQYHKFHPKTEILNTGEEMYQGLKEVEDALFVAGQDIHMIFSREELETFEKVANELVLRYGSPDEHWLIQDSDGGDSQYPVVNI